MLRNPDTKLHVASEKGDLELVKQLLAHGADPNAEGSNKETPLHRAAYYNRADVAQALLASNASCEIRNASSEMPIHVAAAMGSVDAVNAIIKHDPAQLIAQGPQGRTVLFIAVLNNKIDVVQALLQTNCDVNKINFTSGRSVLHEAAIKNYAEIAKLLLSKSDVNLIDTSGYTALQRCAMQKEPSLAVARELIDANADVNKGTPPPLFLLATQASPQADTTEEFAELLLRKGAKLETTYEGQTIFQLLEKRQPNKLYTYLKPHQPHDTHHKEHKKNWKSRLKW